MEDNLKMVENIFNEYLTLKKLCRAGWQLRGIPSPESLADHSFGVAFLTMFLGDWIKDLHKDFEMDSSKTVRMALVHEIGESRIGDIPFPALKYLVSKPEAEAAAVRDIFSECGANGKNYLELFKEFEDGQTIEAKFVRAIDKLEMLISAGEYERIGFRSLNDFWKNPKNFEPFKQFPEIERLSKRLLERHVHRKIESLEL